MRKNLLSKAAAAVTVLAAALAVVTVPAVPASAGGLLINENNFPDAAFRKYIKNNIDTNGDGTISAGEIKHTEHFDVADLGIKNLKGIEYFTYIAFLDCSNNKLTSIDLSKNPRLTSIDCEWNGLTKLVLTNNTQLRELRCDHNKIAKLDLTKNTKLENMRCSDNALESLNVTTCKTLFTCYCSNNKLTKLDVSKNTQLVSLNCENNSLTELSVNNNPLLESLHCSGNSLSKLEISKDKSLTSLQCNDNKITKLDLSKNTKLESLAIKGNSIKTMDLANNKELKFLDCGALECLDVSGCRKLDSITLEEGKFPAELRLACGQSFSLNYYLPPYSDKGTWTCSASGTAGLDGSRITGKKAGKAVLTGDFKGTKHKVSVRVLFKDVTNPKDFWYEPTYYLSDSGIVKGYDNQTSFKPDNECTRAQMVTFLWRLNGEPKPKSSTTAFTDIKKSDYFYKPVLWAVENGITTGASKTTFNPEGVCTRAQTVTFLWRLAGKPSAGTAESPFKDVKKGEYFCDAVIWASKMKIVAGYDDNTFRPQGKCLRRQMVTFLYKYDKYVNGKG